VNQTGLLRVVAATLLLLPWARSIPATPAWAGHFIDYVFLPLCHHSPSRVLALHGEPMCVCSRCAGLYAGLALGFLVSLRLPRAAYETLLWLAVLLAFLDVVTQDAGLHPPFHPVRLATGGFLGWVAASWIVRTVSERAPRSPPAPQPG
jgi:uncharacterized membrane protein